MGVAGKFQTNLSRHCLIRRKGAKRGSDRRDLVMDAGFLANSPRVSLVLQQMFCVDRIRFGCIDHCGFGRYVEIALVWCGETCERVAQSVGSVVTLLGKLGSPEDPCATDDFGYVKCRTHRTDVLSPLICFCPAT